MSDSEGRAVPHQIIGEVLYFEKLADVAAGLGISDRQLRRHVAAGCPGRTERGWPFTSMFTWYIGHMAISGIGKAGGSRRRDRQ